VSTTITSIRSSAPATSSGRSSRVVAITIVVMLVHTYYGYTARGGPAGVGEGRRPGRCGPRLVVAAVEIVMITLAVYGQSGNFHLARLAA